MTLFDSEKLAKCAERAFCVSHGETFVGEVSSDVTAVWILENDPTNQILINGFAYFFAHEWEGGFELALYPTRDDRDKAERAFESKDEGDASIYLMGIGIALLP